MVWGVYNRQCNHTCNKVYNAMSRMKEEWYNALPSQHFSFSKEFSICEWEKSHL